MYYIYIYIYTYYIYHMLLHDSTRLNDTCELAPRITICCYNSTLFELPKLRRGSSKHVPNWWVP